MDAKSEPHVSTWTCLLQPAVLWKEAVPLAVASVSRCQHSPVGRACGPASSPPQASLLSPVKLHAHLSISPIYTAARTTICGFKIKLLLDSLATEWKGPSL